MSFGVKEDETLDPSDIGLLGAEAVVLCSQGDADAVEQAGLLGFAGDGGRDWDDIGHRKEPSNKLCREEGLCGLGEEN